MHEIRCYTHREFNFRELRFPEDGFLKIGIQQSQ